MNHGTACYADKIIRLIKERIPISKHSDGECTNNPYATAQTEKFIENKKKTRTPKAEQYMITQ